MENDERLLSNAVYQTVHDQLDPPPYVFSSLPFEEEQTIIEALGKSAYYLITTNGNRFHPRVLEYYKRWGNRYLQGLRASRRLLKS
jgi:hypothetical protein